MLGKIDASLNKKLNKVEWGKYKLGDLFEIKSTKKRFDANKVKILDSGYPYVTRTNTNNGVKGYLNENKNFLNNGNTISFGQDTATIFYQKEPYFTGNKIKILNPLFNEFNKYNAYFFIASMNRAFSSFSWGTQSYDVNTVLKHIEILLPTKNGKIDFEFMDSFIIELETKYAIELETYLKVTGLDNYELTEEDKKVLEEMKNGKKEFRKFKIGDLFEKIKTKDIPYKVSECPDNPEGKYILPALTAGIKNQGLSCYVPYDETTVLKNCISVSANGSNTGTMFYQDENFTILQDAYAMQLKKQMDNRDVYLFLVSCMKNIKDIYEYSHKLV